MKQQIMGLCFILAGAFCGAEEKAGERYLGYAFTADYTAAADKAFVEQALLRGLKDWYRAGKLHPVKIGSNTVVLYRIDIKPDREVEWAKYRDHKEIILKKRLTEEDWAQWDGMSVIDERGNNRVLIKSGRDDLFSVGHRGRDYYGCIENKPAFTANLIAGNPDAAFLITGSGHYFDTVVIDDITLHIYSHQGERFAKEPLLLVNYETNRLAVKNDKAHVGAAYSRKDFRGLKALDGFGRKRYGKLFVGDFDKDNRLEMLFWFRTYRSTPLSEAFAFAFEKQAFVVYKENEANNGFNRRAISESAGKDLLKAHALTWDAGYPQDNRLCTGEHKKYSMMKGVRDFE